MSSGGDKSGSPGEATEERTPAPIRAMRVIALSRSSPPSRRADASAPSSEETSSPAWSSPEHEVEVDVDVEQGASAGDVGDASAGAGAPGSFPPNPPPVASRPPTGPTPGSFPPPGALPSAVWPSPVPSATSLPQTPGSPISGPPVSGPPVSGPPPISGRPVSGPKAASDRPLPSFSDELSDAATPVFVAPTEDFEEPPVHFEEAESPAPAETPVVEAIVELLAEEARDSEPRISLPGFLQADDIEPLSERHDEELEAELEDVEPTPIAPSYQPREGDEARPETTSGPDVAPVAVAPPASTSSPGDRPPPPKRSPPQSLKATPAGGPARPALPTAKMKKKPWWEEIFGDDFSRSYRPPTPAQIERETTFIERSLALPPGSVVLDLACGQGEYAVELGKRGYSVVGYDLSVFQLAMAADRAQSASQKINFLQGDMREMAFESMFDGIVSWNTSFGYFEEERNADVLRRMYSALRPGGVLLMEVLNRDYAAREAPISNWYEGDGCICMDDMSLDFITSRLTVKRSVILDDGRSKEVTYSIRLYCLSEIGKLFHDVGFVVHSVSGSPSTPGAFLGSNSPSLIIRAERPLK